MGHDRGNTVPCSGFTVGVAHPRNAETDATGSPWLALSTASPEATSAYQEGMDLFSVGRMGVEAALQSAIAADPRFAVPHVALVRHLQSFGRIIRAAPARRN